jgi:hypothetical protein
LAVPRSVVVEAPDFPAAFSDASAARAFRERLALSDLRATACRRENLRDDRGATHQELAATRGRRKPAGSPQLLQTPIARHALPERLVGVCP